MDFQKLFDQIKRTAIITNYEPAEKELPAGASKFGGKPHLPEDFVWPYYEGEDFGGVTKSRPLSFLAQINLGEIGEYDKENELPHSGMLYFFYEMCTMRWGFDPKDRGCARVFYVENPGDLQPTAFPGDLEADFIVPEFALSFEQKTELPDFEELAERETDVGWDQYDEEKVLCGYGDSEDEELSKLLGYANLIQGDMTFECAEIDRGIYCGNVPELSDEQKEQLLFDSNEWVLLFQMSTVTDGDYELMFGDCGSIYFYIKKKDLRERNFDNVWLILQCF